MGKHCSNTDKGDNMEDQQKSESASEMFLAKALFDNIAETPDELAFRRGDVLTVVEQDTAGLDGWWLCSLRGKQGIAPGNRLKILSGMLDTSMERDLYDSPKSESLRRSWDVSQNMVVNQQKIAQGDLYDSPNRSMQDYDVPPTRYFPKEKSPQRASTPNRETTPRRELQRPRSEELLDSNRSQQSKRVSGGSLQEEHSQSFYDTPPSSRPVAQMPESTYDVPPSVVRNSVESCHSSRSSVASDTSNDSSVTVSSCTSNPSLPRLSNPSSTCDSARSSLDVSSHDFYDIPNKDSRKLKQLSADSGLDLYDTPSKSRLSNQSSLIEDYDVPKFKSFDLGAPRSSEKTPEVVRSKSLEHTLDDLYDVPKNNLPKVYLSLNMSGGNASSVNMNTNDSLNVYDVPPQVTRDSVISARSDSSEEGQRLSTCSVDSRGSTSDIPTYDELLLELDAALELLVKLQQLVQKSANKLLAFVSSTWRKKENLQTKMYDIKVACTGLKSSLADFVDFAQGTLANSVKLSDKKLVNKLYKQLNPLQNSLRLISLSLKNLEEMKWQVNLLSEPLDSGQSDDLGQIVSLCKDLTGNVRKLASLIQGNATLLFVRSNELNSSRTSERRCSLDDILMSSKPPIKRKPELKPKQGIRSKYFQQRPLPAPPPTDRPLPPPPAEQKKKSPSLNSLTPPKELYSSSSDDIYQNADEVLVQEYDYVQLESRDIAAHMKHKEELEIQVDLYEKKLEEDLAKVDIGCKSDDSSARSDDGSVKYEENEDDTLNTDDICKYNLLAGQQDQVDSGQIDVDALIEQELKTPVNIKTDASEFILPEKAALPDKLLSQQLDPSDKQVLVFYSGQMETHSTLLTNAIDAFLNCVESSDPPNVFVSHSKFVIISAHKLVHIGDTLHRNLMHSVVRNRVMSCANHLCDTLKLSVTATKMAALQYPSVPAVQEMVDRVMDVSRAAHDLKLVISQVVAL
ncbi:enhancer of filamentation 1-like isoform X2 [Gigantopelta aegis]|uniref:enhancer of filamentation 1-like isoform X2 n=1 Tax=Gigantopelta aegis TaxID=1735272 RepID=UPI001B88BFA5|nr:enhancer of filamentation 1-like isoform X2 [Gigantopelta aegis]